MLYETSVLNSLVELVYVFPLTERARTDDSIAAGASPVLTADLDDGVLGEGLSRTLSRPDAVVLGECVEVCIGEFVGRYEA